MKIQKDHLDRINKVVRHIEAAIDKNMPLEELAELACFSPFHFQRIFKEVLGETPKQFIKRLRLEEAARIISFHPEQNILDVAFHVGFQSLEAFSRAFKDYYTVSPDNYKKRSEIERIHISQLPYRKNTVYEEPEIKISFPAQASSYDDLEIEIVTRQAQKCVYVQTTLQSPQFFKESFRRIQLWAQARELSTSGTLSFGLIKDYPIFTSLDRCRFLACVSVNAPVKPSGLVGYLELPSSKYASFEVEGGLSEIVAAATFLIHSWVPGSGYRLKLEPIVQIPLHDPALHHFNENSHRIYIPVQPE